MITVEKVGDDEISFREFVALGWELGQEAASAPPDFERGVQDGYRIITHNATWIARDGDTDEPVGFLALVEEECGYSAERQLVSKHLYIKPAYRGAGALKPSEALIGLFEAAKAEAEARGLRLYIYIDNRGRNAKLKHISIEAQIVGFEPHAYKIKMR